MTLGRLSAEIELFRPHKTYYGKQEPIAGNVVLEYLPDRRKAAREHNAAELFGPLSLEIIFEGVLTIKTPEQTNGTQEYKKVRRIFRHLHCIHDGPFKCEVDQVFRLPFTINFPDQADASIDFRTGQEIPGRELPPSMQSYLLATAGGYGTVIKYSLHPVVAMAGIDVEIHSGKDVAVSYERPVLGSPPQYWPQSYSHTMEFKLKRTSGQDEKPRRMRALLSKSKKLTYSLDTRLDGLPSVLCLNQPFSLRLSISKNGDNTTATADPPIVLEGAFAQLLGTTRITESGTENGRTYNTSNTQIARLLFTKLVQDDEASLTGSEKIYAANTAVWGVEGVTTSFTYAEVSRTYRLKIELKILVAGKKENVVWESGVEVLPPIMTRAENSQAVDDATAEYLPTYEAACP